jgi:hypothetical protein
MTCVGGENWGKVVQNGRGQGRWFSVKPFCLEGLMLNYLAVNGLVLNQFRGKV